MTWIAGLAALCLPLAAQSFPGSIVGTVADSTGAAVSNSGVTLTNARTLKEGTAKTNENEITSSSTWFRGPSSPNGT